MIFPLMVYKDEGPHRRPGGTFDYHVVDDEKQLAAAKANGWHESLAIALDAGADDSPPTRAELEDKARELGIDFDGRTSDRKLSERIAAALEA